MRILLLIILGISIYSETKAQFPERKFSRLSVEEGLSQSTVKAIQKDSRGYMWFGTRDGLNRYDGYSFTIYQHNSEDETSISSNFITDILEDKDGGLWIGTNNGFCKYDPLTESFKRYSINSTSQYIADLFQDSNGTLWIGTNGGLYEFHEKTKEVFKGYHHEEGNPNSLQDSGINKIAEDQEGNLWVATPLSLERYNRETKIFTHYSHNEKNEKSIGAGFIASVFIDSRDQVWVATTSGGVSLYNPAENSFTRMVPDPKNSNSLSFIDILCFTEDTEGNIWIGTQNGGLSIYNFETGNFENYNLNIYDPGSLGGISIHSLYTDDIGNVWAGTWAGGVSLWSKYGEKFVHYPGFLDLNSTNTYAISGDDEGTIWLGIEEGGLISFDPVRRKFKKHPNANQERINTKVILSIAELNKDTLALGYHVGGFAFFDKNSGTFTHFLPEPDNPKSIFGIVKPSLLVDRENNLWIGDWGGGINLYNRADTSFIHFSHNIKDTTALSDGVVFDLFEDSKGIFWIGTENGLNLFNKETKKFKRYLHDSNIPGSISNNTIHTIFEDRKGNLWIGTAGGLNLFDYDTKTFTAYRIKDGLPNEVIKSIIEDADGNLWLATNQGLSRFDPATFTFRNFDTSDGLQGNEFNRNSYYEAPDGTIYLGGPKGLNFFHPDSVRDNPHIPPVVLTDLLIFNERVKTGAGDSILPKAIDQATEIFLEYENSVITLQFAALNFTSPNKNQYAYRLDGFDKGWNYVGNNRQATYTNLDPGTYTFRVKASNNDGVWNERGTSLQIHILPPFWLTWWFKLIAGIIFIGMGVAFSRYRLLNIRRQNQKLQNLVDERTQELVAKQEKINYQNEQLVLTNTELSQRQEENTIQQEMLTEHLNELFEARKVIEAHNESLDQEVKERTKELLEYNQQLEQFAFIAAHNLRAPVARILGLGQIIKLPGTTKEDEKLVTEKIVLTTEELDQVVRDINTILEIRKNNTLSISKISLQEELAIIKANLAKEIQETNTKILHDFSQGDSLETVKPYLDSILFNLISNAIKYRDPNRRPIIKIKSENVNDNLCLEVSDNGLGIDLDSHKKNMFLLYKRFHSHVEGKGMGLYLVKTQVQALGGNISVESKVNHGTIFRIHLKNKGIAEEAEFSPSSAIAIGRN